MPGWIPGLSSADPRRWKRLWSRARVDTNRKCVLTCSTASSTEISHLPSLKGKPGRQIRSITSRGLRGASEQVKITSGLLWVLKLLQQTIFTLYMCHSELLFQSERIQPGSSQVPPNTSAVTPPSVHSGFPRRSVHRRSCSGFFFSLHPLSDHDLQEHQQNRKYINTESLG